MSTWIWAASISVCAWVVIKALAGLVIIRMATNKATGEDLDNILDALHETRFVPRALVIIRRWWIKRRHAE